MVQPWKHGNLHLHASQQKNCVASISDKGLGVGNKVVASVRVVGFYVPLLVWVNNPTASTFACGLHSLGSFLRRNNIRWSTSYLWHLCLPFTFLCLWVQSFGIISASKWCSRVSTNVQSQ